MLKPIEGRGGPSVEFGVLMDSCLLHGGSLGRPQSRLLRGCDRGNWPEVPRAVRVSLDC
ncbi:hypothetical protein DSO57_1023336 [Entomophthora muscae]|uniref:Uncharacterized protein n=1 Tax=Entomophthora muscae TaxID=34485 RepID=A0ACC2UMS7_9FUNG|nr:hypothetical protein DSO57_1023336 [Entomophthora muscae]